MSVQVENLEKNMAKLTIEVSAEDLEKALESAYQKQKKQISVPGFRKGKAPRKMIEQMYGKGVFLEDAVNALIPEHYSKALAECELEIVSQPTIDITQAEPGKAFIFTAEVAVKPEVTLGEYKGLEVPKTVDELGEVAQKFKDAGLSPDYSIAGIDNGGRTYSNFLNSSNNGYGFDAVYQAFNATPGYFLKDDSGELYWGTTTDEMKEVYPFDFELYISYRLKKNVIEVEWGIKNPSEETIYFTIGGHPAIHFAKENETKADYRLYFPEKDHLNYILVDIAEGGADPKKVYEMKLEDGYYPLTEELFERDALIFDENQIEEVWISHKDGTPYVGMKCEGFSNFGIWSVKDAPFVCLEPWMGRCDDVGFEGDISLSLIHI